jgi:hypothetical protein
MLYFDQGIADGGNDSEVHEAYHAVAIASSSCKPARPSRTAPLPPLVVELLEALDVVVAFSASPGFKVQVGTAAAKVTTASSATMTRITESEILLDRFMEL